MAGGEEGGSGEGFDEVITGGGGEIVQVGNMSGVWEGVRTVPHYCTEQARQVPT